jgi:hypothetical protein
MAKSITASLMIHLAARKIDSQTEEMTALKMTMGVTMLMIWW